MALIDGDFAVYVPRVDALLDQHNIWDSAAIRRHIEVQPDLLPSHVFVIARDYAPADLNHNTLMSVLRAIAGAMDICIALRTFGARGTRMTAQSLNKEAVRRVEFLLVTNAPFVGVAEEEGWRYIHERLMKTRIEERVYTADIRELVQSRLVFPREWSDLLVTDEQGKIITP